MRPHTRTQCNDGKDCVECGQGGLSAASHPSSSIENTNEIGPGVKSTSNNKNVTPGLIDSTHGPQDKTEKRFERVYYFYETNISNTLKYYNRIEENKIIYFDIITLNLFLLNQQ